MSMTEIRDMFYVVMFLDDGLVSSTKQVDFFFALYYFMSLHTNVKVKTVNLFL